MTPLPYPLCEPQVLLAKSQTVRFFLRKENLILPGRVRTRPEILARTFQGKGTQPASSGNGRRRRGQARTEREGSRFGLARVPSAHTC